MHPEAVGDQHGADHQQEAEREHHDGRVVLDEVRERIGGYQHQPDRDHHGGDHDRQRARHADRGQDRIDREDNVEQHDLHDCRAEAQASGLGGAFVVRRVAAVERVMNLLGRLPDQEQAARDQDQIAQREGRVERTVAVDQRAVDAEIDQRRGQPDQPRDRRKQRQPQHQRQCDADPARARLPGGRQAVGENRDEHEIVDAEHHLHHDQRG